ncbi:MAG: hypothetical protein R8G33_03455 [Gammaproteobacteria bacterium]|nr:hypothetical protein [Gammaproteobacteria bacterium]
MTTNNRNNKDIIIPDHNVLGSPKRVGVNTPGDSTKEEPNKHNDIIKKTIK